MDSEELKNIVNAHPKSRLFSFSHRSKGGAVRFYRHSEFDGVEVPFADILDLATRPEPQLSELDQAYLEYGKLSAEHHSKLYGVPIKTMSDALRKVRDLEGDKIENKVDVPKVRRQLILCLKEVQDHETNIIFNVDWSITFKRPNYREWNVWPFEILAVLQAEAEPELTPLQEKKIELADFAISGGCDAPVHLVQEIKAMIAVETPKPSLAERARELLTHDLGGRWAEMQIRNLLQEIAKETQ